MRTHALPAVLLSLALAAAAPPPSPPKLGAAAEALPPLDHSPLLRAKAATYLLPQEPVLGVEMGGDARAYPLRILDWHGVANETVDRIPVAVSYCRPCGAAALYRTDTPKGILILAASGRYREGDLLLADRQTGTLWSQLTGLPVEGPLAGSGIRLQPLPVVLTTWTSWFQAHPETRVLSLETGAGRTYEPGGRPGDDPVLPVSRRSPALPETSWVYGLMVKDEARAYPVDRVAKAGTVDDELAGVPIVLVADPGADSRSRTVRAYERGDRVFARSGHPFLGAAFVNDQDGHPWKIGEEALATSDGKRLRRLPGNLAYWRGWFAAYPRTEVYGEPKTAAP
ncbi:MAG TPA: DUF3179 domain-containing (seleno)protein [Thermoanaerobaculia bacterium]|jgi:hypothetical protein